MSKPIKKTATSKKKPVSKKKTDLPENNEKPAEKPEGYVVSETFEKLFFLVSNGLGDLREHLQHLTKNELGRILIGILEHPVEDSIKIPENKDEITKLNPSKQREIFVTHLGRDLQTMKVHMAFERAKFDANEAKREKNNVIQENNTAGTTSSSSEEIAS